MARPLKFTDTMLARFASGTFDRIARLLVPGEDRASFIRNAVDREIERREVSIDHRASTVGFEAGSGDLNAGK